MTSNICILGISIIGGDEFVIILLETTEDPALEIIQKVQKELLSAMEYKLYPGTFKKFPKTSRKMLKLTDDCMYKAKLRKAKIK